MTDDTLLSAMPSEDGASSRPMNSWLWSVEATLRRDKKAIHTYKAGKHN